MAMSDLAPRLAKMIPRLASDHPGEVVATVAAIRRTLEAGGLDLHALAAAIGNPPVVCTEPPRAKPHASHQMDARRCLQSGRSWNPREAQFLHQMASQRRRPSDKQRDWLDGLLDLAARHYRGNTQ